MRIPAPGWPDLLHLAVVLFTGTVVGVTYHSGRHTRLLWQVTKEDSLFEVATVVALLVLAVYAAGAISRRRKWHLSAWHVSALCTLAILCVVAALEEISWGQRYLGLETAEYFREYNRQGETNLHNLVDPAYFSGALYTPIVAYFVFLPIVSVLFRLPDRWPWLRAHGYLIPRTKHALMVLYAMVLFHYRVKYQIEYLHIALFFVALAGVAHVVVFRTVDREPVDAVHLVLLVGSLLLFLTHRSVFRFDNMQNEIREFVVIYTVGFWLRDVLRSYRRRREPLRT